MKLLQVHKPLSRSKTHVSWTVDVSEQLSWTASIEKRGKNWRYEFHSTHIEFSSTDSYASARSAKKGLERKLTGVALISASCMGW